MENVPSVKINNNQGINMGKISAEQENKPSIKLVLVIAQQNCQTKIQVNRKHNHRGVYEISKVL